MSALQLAWSSGRRACSAATAAPALHDLSTDSAISSGWVGRLGLACLDAMPPVGATVTMTLFDAMLKLPLLVRSGASLFRLEAGFLHDRPQPFALRADALGEVARAHHGGPVLEPRQRLLQLGRRRRGADRAVQALHDRRRGLRRQPHAEPLLGGQ